MSRSRAFFGFDLAKGRDYTVVVDTRRGIRTARVLDRKLYDVPAPRRRRRRKP